MENIKIGRITLAFTFISLGLTILLDKYMSYKLIDLLFILWPITLIVLGTEIIYGSFSKGRDHKVKSNLDIVSIAIILIFVAVTGTTNLSSKFLGRNYKYKEDVSEQVIIDEDKKVIIDDENIDIEVFKSEDKDTKIKIEGVYGHDGDIKKRKMKLLKVNSTDRGTMVTRNTKEKTVNFININSSDMKYIVELPKDVELEIINKYGDISVEDIESNVNIKTNTSDIDFKNVSGNIYILNSYGDFNGKKLIGNIDITSKSGDVDLDLITMKNVNIATEYGDVTVELPKEQVGKFNIIATYGNIYDELGFDIIESASMSSINETRKQLNPILNIRADNGDVILETN